MGTLPERSAFTLAPRARAAGTIAAPAAASRAGPARVIEARVIGGLVIEGRVIEGRTIVAIAFPPRTVAANLNSGCLRR
jgi:hypothetical protein